MDVGRELDALMAEKVMGWDWYTVVGINVLLPPGHHYRERSVLATVGKHGTEDDIDSMRFCSSRDGGYQMPIVPHYSTDIAAAWEVVEKLEELYCFSIRTVRDQSDNKYVAELSPLHSARYTVPDKTYYAYAATAPLAICLVAKQSAEWRIDQKG